MEIVKVNIDGQEFKMFKDVVLFPNTEKAVTIDYIAEQRLDDFIVKKIDEEKYVGEVRAVDEMYGYSVPQSVADTDNEADICESIEDIYDENDFIKI